MCPGGGDREGVIGFSEAGPERCTRRKPGREERALRCGPPQIQRPGGVRSNGPGLGAEGGQVRLEAPPAAIPWGAC